MFKFKALILSVFSFKTSWAKSPNLLIFKIMSAAMTKWHLFRSCNKNMHYLTLGSVPWQSNVCLPHTNAASPLLNGCVQPATLLSNDNNCYLLLLAQWIMSVLCKFALLWGMGGLFPETGWGNTWFFPFPELGGWRTGWRKCLLSLLAIHCVHLVCQKRSAAAVNAEQRLIAGCCSTRRGWGKLIAPCHWKGVGGSFPTFPFPLVTLGLGSSP